MDIKPWSELVDYQTPKWMKECKFGIYTHWGIYCVPACGPNVSWYGHNMYRRGTEQYEYHCRKYGGPEKFGYKDFIPMFTGEKFDAEEWAEIFKKSGAGFAGPVAEHHDGFSMWDSKVNPWNAAAMGPCRDVVGELEKAVRAQNMKFMTAFHHAENWRFFPHWYRQFDAADPKYAGLYGEAHDLQWAEPGAFIPEDIWGAQCLPGKAFHEQWFAKEKEVIDAYHPDYIWFDFGLRFVQESYKRRFLTYYREEAARRGQEIAISYKDHDLPLGTGLVDLEQGRFDQMTYHDWITDTTVDDGQAWGYMQDSGYKSTKSLLHYLIDNVSKNGYLLLNVGPKADGTLPDEAKAILYGMGDWLGQYGEAIYGTSPWRTAEEGPTRMKKSGSFCEMDEVQYTAQDLRFTMKDSSIYAISLGMPGDRVRIHNFEDNFVYPGEIARVTALGDDHPLPTYWEGRTFVIDAAHAKKNEIATVFKIERRSPFEA